MSQNSDTSSGLTRGLIARRGAQNASTQRLPSLRSESHSSQLLIPSNISTNSLPVTTKGGALKRTFKPTIPVRRNPNEDNSVNNEHNDNSNRSRRGKQLRTNTRNNRQFDSKKFVQLDAAVFNGANNPELRSSRLTDMPSNRKRSSLTNETRIKSESRTDNQLRNRSDDKSPTRHDSKIKLENKAGIIRKLYGDNFIDDDYEHDQDLVLPKGWESVSSHRVAKQSNTEPLNPYNLLKTDNEEKLLLMQIPDAFLKRSDGYVGKLRVYKSGRVQLEDSDSGIKFDILFDKSLSLAKNVKQENKPKEVNSNQIESDISQDVVSFKGNNLTVLGTLGHEEVLLAVPQIPLDDHIGPTIPL